MRRIFKTTTAIIACLALVAPQLATAQDQSEGGLPKKLLPRHGQQEQPAAAQPAPKHQTRPCAEKPALLKAEPSRQPHSRPQHPRSRLAEAPAPQAKKAAKPQPEAAAKPAAKAKAPAEPAPVKAQAEKQPAKKPPLTQAKDPGKEAGGRAGGNPDRPNRRRNEAPSMPTRAQKPPKPTAPEAAAKADASAPTKPAVKQPAAEGTPIGAEALREKLAAEAGQQPAKPAKPGKAAPEQAANDGKPLDMPKSTAPRLAPTPCAKNLPPKPASTREAGKARPASTGANCGHGDKPVEVLAPEAKVSAERCRHPRRRAGDVLEGGGAGLGRKARRGQGR